VLIENYTTFDGIRSILGVSAKELKDETLALDIYSTGLEADLEDVNIGVPAAYLAALQAEPATDEEARFVRIAQTFAAYAVARNLTVSLSVFSPVKIEDGKAAMTRISDPHRETVAAIHREYDLWKRRLLAAYEAVVSSSSTPITAVYFGTIEPAQDPITGT
jgi:hypothetical protein